MGTTLKDFAQLERNLDGKSKPPQKDKPFEAKKICSYCGFSIRSAIIRPLLFKDDLCVDCVKKIGCKR